MNLNGSFVYFLEKVKGINKDENIKRLKPKVYCRV